MNDGSSFIKREAGKTWRLRTHLSHLATEGTIADFVSILRTNTVSAILRKNISLLEVEPAADYANLAQALGEKHATKPFACLKVTERLLVGDTKISHNCHIQTNGCPMACRLHDINQDLLSQDESSNEGSGH